MRSLLTSSHLVPPAETSGIHGVFKRPRDSQCRGQTCSVRRTPPPAFLFPNQRCQRPDRLTGPPFNARGRQGAAYLVAVQIRVNRLSVGVADQGRRVTPGAKRVPGPPRGFPHQSGNESVGAGDANPGTVKMQDSFVSPLTARTVSRRGAAYRRGPFGAQPVFASRVPVLRRWFVKLERAD